ncbi:MAG TPA: YidC/Oxa1 family membrane protein insertase [Egicoccus sp.]|nr:YidC/Oxa1 family membrane protein insertase [Egicoccus sp.]HSK24351.1 YidC/Oxa1 family membrane protein insertase [Egicoccus sp.]
MGDLWQTVRDGAIGALDSLLTLLHDLVEPVFGLHAWGWAIILLTIIVRVALLPLAIKQTRSMRAMQALAPQLKEIQKKYKVDRELLKKDPEQYKAKRQKLNEEQMALYQREGVNPAASCLPLLLQAPIFLALFWTLQYAGRAGGGLRGAEFYFFTGIGEGGLEMVVRNAGWPGWLLIVLMSGTMFWSQKQMMARNAATQAADNPMAQQQKILLYVMPVFLAFISFNFPLGILLYWVTTNFWQVVQQWVILREVKHEVETGTLAEHPGGEAAAGDHKRKGNKPKGGATSGSSKPDAKPTPDAKPKPKRDTPGGAKGGNAGGAAKGEDDARPSKKRDHLPRRGDTPRDR